MAAEGEAGEAQALDTETDFMDEPSKQVALNIVRQLISLTEMQRDVIVDLREQVDSLRGKLGALGASQAERTAHDSPRDDTAAKETACEDLPQRPKQVLGKRSRRGRPDEEADAEDTVTGAGAGGASKEIRQCIICGTTETPKWRGKNTLCNACGLRVLKQVRPSRRCSAWRAETAVDLTPSRLSRPRAADGSDGAETRGAGE